MFVSCVLILSSLQAPTKLVPLSERRSLAGPRTAKHLLKALMKLSVVMDSMSSKWTALVDMHVNITAQRLLSAILPLVLRVVMAHGPKTSRPTLVNGGSGVSLSAGRSAIFCSCRTGHAPVDDRRHQTLTGNDPVACCSDGSLCYVSPLMHHLLMVKPHQESGDVVSAWDKQWVFLFT